MERDDPDLIERSLDGLDDVFYIYDCDGRLSHWNRQLNDRFGLTDEDLDGMRPEAFFLPDDRDRVRAAVEEVFETGETVVEARAETTDGVVVFQLTGRLVTDDDGTPLGFCGVGRDVTAHRERERLLARQNDRLEEFADIVAHDLRNPLGVAMGRLEFARESDDSEHLRAVAAALDRIGRIVDDVLTAAREGGAVTDAEPVSLAAVAWDAWASVDTGDATLDVTTERTVTADEARLRRLLENLFRNAVEHGSTGGPDDALSVTVEATPHGFAVVDDGLGIPPEDRERVFAPGVSRSDDGTGFGLHIVETLAAAHGWTVRLEEDAGGGARFVFDVGGPLDADAHLFPVRQPDSASQGRADDTTAEAPGDPG